jgi:6-phospho-3-hexuloisomerase
MFSSACQAILSEIKTILSDINEEEVAKLLEEILQAKTIIVYGAGRVGMAIRGFGMRLGHLGFEAYTLGDSTVPHIGSGDLLLLASGSGETQTVFDIAVLGKKNNARLALITGRKDSRIGKIADTLVQLNAPSKVNASQNIASIQPMTTLNEQCLQIFFDTLVILLMEKTNQKGEDLWKRHSNLE